LTDEEGRVLWHAALGAFGPEDTGVETDVAGQEDDQRAAGSPHAGFQPLRMQGQYIDSATGLWYNRFRYYDPLVGRFTSPDPIKLLGGLNTYRYAPNAFSWIDPHGLHHVTQSRIDGARREKAEAISIVRKGKGKVRVQRECYLRDCTTGERVADDKGKLKTGEFRRLDIVVINVATGSVMRTVEVTSKTNVTGKDDQLAKERRIRKNGGLCIRDRKTKTLKRVPRVSRVVGRK
jgi:RHS repeat-associated protein